MASSVALGQGPATWTRWEAALTSTASYSNAYADVTVSATYSGPGGQTFSSYGFWDGESTWKLRCAFPAPGLWQWQTTCSNPGDAGLHSRTGQVTVSAYSGSNPLYAKGFLKVTVPNRYLTYNDGTPFFWVADTPWSAGMNATVAEWESYVDKRASQKFTVFQMLPSNLFWGGTTNHNGHRPFFDTNGNGTSDEVSQWNPAYWRDFDEKVQYANGKGVAVFLVGIMEPVYEFPTAAEGRLFARNLAARYYGNHVIFSPSFDDQAGRTVLADAVGEELNAATTRHLITHHPGTDLPTAKAWHGKPYTDFTGLQTGAGWGWNTVPFQFHSEVRNTNAVNEVARNAVNWCRELYETMPTNRPIVNLEARYDGPWLQSYLPRIPWSCGYWSVLNGTAGYTVGTVGIWNWGVPGYQHWDAAGTWTEGRDGVCAMRIQYFCELFTTRAWWTLAPASELIRNQTPATDYVNKMALAKSASGALAVAYLPDNPAIQIDMNAFPTPMKATWFNCATGIYTTGPADVTNSGTRTLNRPASGDWALVLQSVSDSGSSAGLLTGAVAPAHISGYNLTEWGTLDWAHWGRAGTTDAFDHKVADGSRISDLTPFISQDYPGAPSAYGATRLSSRSASWSDGSPTLNASADDGCFFNAQQPGGGWSFTVAADTTLRTLYVYCGGDGSYATLKARLSDGSAPDYGITNSGAGSYQNLHRITYQAGQVGKRLTVSYLKTQEYGEPGGTVDLSAAWLTSGAPVVIQGFEANGANLQLIIHSPFAPVTHLLEQTGSLTVPSWATVPGVVFSRESDGTLIASFPKPVGTAAFYRVIAQ